jgi:hypothetical protein
LDWWFDLLDTHTFMHEVHTLPPSPTVMSSLAVARYSFQRQMFPFLWVPKLSSVSATSFSQQQQSSHSLAHSLTN